MPTMHGTTDMREVAKTSRQLEWVNREKRTATTAIPKAHNVPTTISILILFRLSLRSCSMSIAPLRNHFSMPKG